MLEPTRAAGQMSDNSKLSDIYKIPKVFLILFRRFKVMAKDKYHDLVKTAVIDTRLITQRKNKSTSFS